jgi:alkylation response protein AidB-like acyl-CoA dehydrogenase
VAVTRAVNDVVQTARGLGPEIAAVADEIERERRLPAALVERLVEAGLFRMLVPASLGGLQLDLPTYVKAVEELARADASVAWCVGQASGLSMLAAYMEPEAATRIFVETQPAIMANGPGEGNKPGCARKVPSGYRITGKWNFASGIRHATWIDAICQVEGEPKTRLMLLPIEQVTLLDTWQVSGLRGTGSFSFTLDDVFVADAFSVVQSSEFRRETGPPLYLFSSSGVFGPSFGSVALGIAQAMLSSLLELAQDKTPRGLGRMRESATVQAVVARSKAKLDGARLLLHTTLQEVWQQVQHTQRLELDQQVRVRLAATNATHEARAVAQAVYEAAGSTAIFADRPFERRFRDIHAVSQQLQGRAAHFETVGRYLLGLDPDRQFL